MTLAASLDFSAKRTIAWARPDGCPAKLEPQQLHSGNDDGDLAIEIGIARWSGTDAPSREALSKLHKDRAGRGINPVVVMAFADAQAWIFGPNSQAAVVGPIALDHAQRLLQSALNEPSGLDARRNLNQSFEAIAATSSGNQQGDALRGVGNAGLFATHELRNGVRSRSDWDAAVQRSKDMMSLRKTELIKRLGYSLEDVGGNASLLKSTGENPRAVAVILLDNETFDGQSNRFAVSPVAFGLQVADRKEVSWLMLLRKDAIRLYPARLDLGVGRKGLAETYFELNLAVADDSTAGFLSLIFSAEALSENGSCYQILKSSSQYAVGLGARLRDKVYGEIVPRLSLAVAAQLPRHGVQMDRDGLNRAYQITLRIFFRMLFQAYADDRKLLPYGENDDYTKNAIKSFAKKLISDDGLVFDDESTSYWDDLIQVWRAIDTGSRRFGIPAYNGGLFSSDEELQPEGALIERLRLTDDVIGPVLRALLIDTADDGTVGPIDFRSLSVREFGTIYEGLLESNLGLADTDLVLDGDDTWIPAPKGAKLEPGRSAKKGTVYFHDTSGARKGTGSYFTPSFVVEHLLERSLDPALDMHLERVKAVLESGNQVGAADLFFDFKVADLAMGSAHFLTAAIDHIEQRMAGFLDAHPIPGITNELRRLEEAAKEKLGENATVPEPSSLLRRQIARRCIYGLDINPVAVELARVSIWIHTFVRGLPMSSLDHTLVCANSLTGIGTVDEALSVLVPERKGNQLTIFDDPIRSALTKAQEILTEVAKAAELDSKESKAASRATQKARKDAEEAKLLFDAAVLTRIGRGDIVAGTEPSEIAQLAADSQAQAALAPLQPAHMPLLFPEVFLRERGGFDVLIGNPPWDMVHVEEDVWWGRHIPGVRGLPVKEMNAAIERYRRDRPDLQEQFDRDRRESDLIREVLLAGPYPGTGSGHLDLYQVFAWRNYQCSSTSGRFGLVLPRVALSGSGSKLWRKELLSTGSLEVVFVVNNRKWVFQEVHAQYSMVFASGVRESDFHGISMSGPFFSLEEFASGRSQFVSLDYETILSGSPSFVVPVLSSSMSASVYTRMRMAPPLSGHPEFEFRPVQGDLNAASDKDRYQKGGSIDGASLPVLAGASFNLWNPRFGPIYGAADKKDFLAWLLEKSKRASKNPRSAHFGETYETAADLPIAASRICYRGVSNATDTRTIIAALIPPHSAMTHGSPYLKRVRGSESDEAYLLGVMCSIPFDWYMRKWVELNVTFELLQPSPIPTGMSAPKLRDSVVRIAGRLAAVDIRFAKWASAVGVEVDSVSDGERAGLEAELDALVAHLYGLTRDQVEHIFKTFHRGWVYAPRLAQVLAHFDSITRTNS